MTDRATTGRPLRLAARLGVALALAAAPAVAQGPDSPGPANYGRTPDTIIPFRNFHDPYLRFFQAPMEFLGAGRDYTPDVLPATVRIGLLGPLGSAPDGDLGQYMLEGVTLALEQANAAGGWRDIPFELVTRSDGGLWGASSNELVDFSYTDKVLAVIGSIDGASTHVALRVALKTGMPMVNTGSTDPTLTETNIPWLLRCMADDRQQGYALAEHIFNECKIDRIVAFRVNDRYGRTGISEFRDAARRLRHPLRAELRWERGDREFTAQLDRIAELEPEAIILWGNAADAAAVVREIRRRKMDVRIFGSDRLASRAFLDAAGLAAEGVVAAASYSPVSDLPRRRAFVEAFTARFDRVPETFAAHGYDGANILIEAIRTAGLNRVRIRDALYACTRHDGVTGPILFDTTLNDIGPVYLATARDGRFEYRRVNFSPAAPRAGGETPYRAMAQSPPAARSPDRGADRAPAVLRIGCFLPLDETGRAAVDGINAAIARDAALHPGGTPVELVLRDARAAWGDNAGGLAEMVLQDEVLAVIGSTGRRGTHLAEMLAAKLHFPVMTLCGTDPTINLIPMPWVFCVAPGDRTFGAHALGHDAAAVMLARIRSGVHSRRGLRDALATGDWHEGMTGTFRFDSLGRRVDPVHQTASGNGVQQ